MPKVITAFRKLFSDRLRLTLKSHCFIQLTPILIPGFKMQENGPHRCVPDPEDLPEGVGEKVQRFVADECDAFSEWAGTKTIGGGVEAGYTHVFVIWYTPPPEDKKFDDSPYVSEFLREIYSSLFLGDIGTEFDGQSFSKRCRWKEPWK